MTTLKKFQEQFSKYLNSSLKEQSISQKDFAHRIAQHENVRGSTARVNRWLNGTWDRKNSGSRPSLPDIFEFCEIAQELGHTPASALLALIHGTDPRSVAIDRENVVEGLGTRWYVRERLVSKSRKANSALMQLRYLLGEEGTSAPTQSEDSNRLVMMSGLLSSAIEINTVTRDHDLELKLAKKYGLDHDRVYVSSFSLASARVTPRLAGSAAALRSEVVSHLAAAEKYVFNSITQVDSVALAGGRPIARFVDQLRPFSTRLARIKWLSMLTSAEDATSADGTSANCVVSRMAHRHSAGSGIFVPLAKGPVQDKALAAIANVQVAMISVGAKEKGFDRSHHTGVSRTRQRFDKLSLSDQSKCVGDILLNFVDAEGNILGNDDVRQQYAEDVATIPLDQLHAIAQRGCVWLIADDKLKAPVVRAALRKGYVSGLILDHDLADLLETSALSSSH